MKGTALQKKNGQPGYPSWPFCSQCCSLACVLPNVQLSLVGFGFA